jgi:pyruvate-formate lyase-activating enzyme
VVNDAASDHPALGAGLLLDLVQQVGATARHGVVRVPLGPGDFDASASIVASWCERSGNELVSIADGVAAVRRGRSADPFADLMPDQMPGFRLWMYTNFDCNLACDYCCVRSSPQTDRAALGLDRVRRLATEAVQAGVSELVLTGGEPFLLPDIDDLVAACTAALPTTLLTNGMLFRGRRLDTLRRMDRNRLTLQVSLDSPTSEIHDSHRGRGSWDKAVAGITLAKQEGFRVKVAATLPYEQTHQVTPFHAFLEGLGIAQGDRVVRALAHRGSAEHGLELTVETLIPEVTITATGVYWHPVSAEHADQLVSRTIFPLHSAIDEVRRRFAEHRAHAVATAQWFPCA